MAGTMHAHAQTAERCEDRGVDGHIVRSVKVEARGGWVPDIPLPIVAGDKFNRDRLLPAFRAVRDALENDPIQQNFELESRGAVSLLSVVACVKVIEESECQKAIKAFKKPAGGGELETPRQEAQTEAKCVDVIIQPTYLRLDLYNIGSNAISIPRSNRPTFYSQAPRSLLALNPTFGMNHDREYGVSEMAGISTNLLDLPAVLRGDPVSARKTKLDLDLMGRKSLNEPFYQAQSSLSFARRQPGKLIEDMAIEVSFQSDQQPLGEGKYFSNVAKLGGGLKLRSRLGPLNSIALDGKYRWSGNRFFSRDGARSELTSESAFEGRAIVDGRLGGGFTRLGVWLDVSAPKKQAFGAYRRLVGIVGYQNEFGRANQTVGVELILGGGRAWGNAPEYARFYGGASLGNFLYDVADSTALKTFPAGPLLRSFGQGQAGVRTEANTAHGGTSFWHLNTNVSIPIPKLSYPLIPPINIFDDDQGGGPSGGGNKQAKTLKDVLKAQVRTGESVLAAEFTEQLISEGVPADEAERQADARAAKIFKEITPAVKFIADQANIYALKPLIMFDAARIKAPGGIDNRTRVAVGGGLQLTIVVAKFEVGYLRTVRSSPGDPRGNFVVRLVFQNLF